MQPKVRLNEELLNYAVLGGSILGGGGGGAREAGLEAGRVAIAYGAPTLVDIADMPEGCMLLTTALVGAPAAPAQRVKPKDYVRALQLLEENTGLKIGGLITNENGGAATVNGWIQAAFLGIPIVDAPCDGRAHPTGMMGSMGLDRLPDYTACQAAAGGDPAANRYVETFVRGSIENTASLIRQASIAAGGMIAVARNPVAAGYVKQHGAVCGISHAIETGRVFCGGLKKSPREAIERVAAFLKGGIVAQGRIEAFSLATTNGFDVGKLSVGPYELRFWNEYMTVEKGQERLATFPDLIMTFDEDTGLPLTTSAIAKGQSVVIMTTDGENLRLGSGARDRDLIATIEPIVQKDIVKYLRAGL